MDPLTLAAIGAPIMGGIAGSVLGGADRDKQMELLQQALSDIQNIQDPGEQELQLEKLRQVGLLTPEVETAIMQGETELKNISVSPEYEKAQMEALSSLQQIGKEGGLTAADKQRLYEIQSQQAQAERGGREAALQSARARGVSGGGSELAATLMAGQSAANRAASQGMDVKAQAEQRALDAIQQSGTLAGQIGEQQYGRQKDVASAQDIINKFNTGTQQGVLQRNIDRQNQAQQYNLQTAQDIANQNAALANQERQYNTQAAQRLYQRQLQKAQASGGAMGNLANAYGGKAANTQQMWTGIGQGVGTGAAYASRYGSKKPTDEEEIDNLG